VNINGLVTSQTGYLPWGGVDLSIGSSPTDYGYTGQRLIDKLTTLKGMEKSELLDSFLN